MSKSHTPKEPLLIKVKTFRFKFSDNICELLLEFSQQHKFDSKNDFKENWDVWTTYIQADIDRERMRLESIGFKGNIIDKMYKSVRYYYCKKHTLSTETQEKRRKYISKNINFIHLIDNFIKRQCFEDENTYSIICDLKPSQGWKLFSDLHRELVAVEIDRITRENNDINTDDAISKIRKTFNNRYFINIRSRKSEN